MGVQNKRSIRSEEFPNADWEGECEDCHLTVSRFRGEGDVTCTCGAEYNCFGQRLNDNWRDNPSNYDDEIGDMEGYEIAALRREAHDA